MARLHVDINDLRDDLEMALGLIRRGGQVMIEREGHVVAELVAPGGAARPAQEHSVPAADFFASPEAMGTVASLLRAQGGVELPAEIWDELNREEALLEMLAEEMD